MKELGLCLITLIIFPEIKPFDPVQFIGEVGSVVCPYTNFCFTNASNVIKSRNIGPCCRECSCEEDCWESQNCCPDKTSKENKSTELNCKVSVTKGARLADYDGYINGIWRYLIIDRCPESSTFTEDNLKRKCSGENRTLLDDYIWVSDISTGRIFQNYHCAKCHKVSHWIKWEIRTDCTDIFPAAFEKFAKIILSNNCAIINQAPPSQANISNKYRCFIPEFTVCNQSRLWSVYDADIDLACKRFSQVFFDSRFWIRIYKNVFCFLCNVEDEPSKLCPNLDVVTRSFSGTFTTLLDLDGTEMMQPKSTYCRMDELYDPYLRICRQLICPLGSAPLFGQCKEFVVDVTGLRIFTCLSLHFISDKTTGFEEINLVIERNNETYIGQLINQGIKNNLGLRKCKQCRSIIRMSKHTQAIPDFIIKLDVSSNPNCQLAYVYKGLTAMLRRKLEIKLSESFVLMLSPTLQRGECNMWINDTVKIYDEDATPNCHYMGQSVIVAEPCPSFRLDVSDALFQADALFKVKEKEHDYRNHFSLFKVDNDTSISVCTQDYFDKLTQLSSTAKQTRIPLILAIMLVLLVVSRRAKVWNRIITFEE